MPDDKMDIIAPENKHVSSLIFRDPVFAIFLLYIFAWFTELGKRWAHWTGGIRIEAVLVAVLLAVYLVGFSSNRREDREKAGFAFYVFLYFAVLLIQVVNSWDSENSWLIFCDRVLKYSLMALFISFFTKSSDKLKLVVLTFLLACFKITQEGVVGGVTGYLVWENQGIPRLHGSVPLYIHPNSLSQLALGTLPFIYYLYPIVKKKLLKAGLLLLLASSIYCIIFTGSRTGYLGSIFMLLLVFYKASARNKKRIILSAMVIVPLLIGFTPKSYRQRFDTIFSGHEAEGSSKEARIHMYGEGWKIFKMHPFGVGVGNYELANEKYYGYSQEVHCLYLEALTHIGIQGFLIFMLLIAKIIAVLRKLDQKLKMLIAQARNQMGSDAQLDELNFLQAVLRSTFIFLSLRLFVDIFGMDLYGICWWLVIGIASALTYLSTDIQKRMNVSIS